MFTGGKDSTASMIMAIKNGLSPDLLVTVKPFTQDSYMFHSINVRHTIYHALLLGRKIIHYSVSGVKEKEVDELTNLIEILYDAGYDIVTIGGIASRYQKNRFEKIFDRFGIKIYSPFWDMAQDEILFRYYGLGLKYMIVAVAAKGLDKNMLGWIIDSPDDVEKLIKLGRRYGFNPTGEGGEYESFVLYAPFFKGSLVPLEYDVYWDGVSGYMNITSLGIKWNLKNSVNEIINR